MKQIISLVFLALLLGATHAQAPKKETLIIKTTIHCDHCLQCESCGYQISDAIRKTKGIGSVKINPKENTITVSYKPTRTNPDKIRQAISAVGYDADDIKASPAGYAKLDGCCKPK